MQPSAEPHALPQGAGPTPVSRQRGRRVRHWFATAGVIAVCAAAVVAGNTLISARAEQSPVPAPVLATEVSTMVLELQDGFELAREFVGQVEAARGTILSFETGGALADVIVDEGATVAAGEPLAKLDTRLLRAERKRLRATRRAIEAQRELARRTADRREKLRHKGYVSGQQLDQDGTSVAELNARLAEVDATLLGIAIRLEKATLTAPFDGRITVRNLDPGATAGPGQAVFSIVESAPPRLRVGIDPILASALEPGQTMNAQLNGRRYPARFLTLMPEINPATRAHDALFALDPTDSPDLLPGASATITLTERVSQHGAWLPLTALRNGVRGTWEILTVVEANGIHEVGLEAVQIVHADEHRAFVTGSFAPDAVVIREGIHRVVKGQPVTVRPADLAQRDSAAKGAL